MFRVRVRFTVRLVTVLHITQVITCRMVLHIMDFRVFFSLFTEGHAYNPSGYMQDHPAYNISLTYCRVTLGLVPLLSGCVDFAVRVRGSMMRR